MAQSVNVPPLDCSGMKSWPHGSSLINYMKLTEFRYSSRYFNFHYYFLPENCKPYIFSGLSGMIKFDTYGMRTDFSMEVLELQDTGLEPVGTWSNIDGLNMSRESEVTTMANPINIMANKTFVVTLIENQVILLTLSSGGNKHT